LLMIYVSRGSEHPILEMWCHLSVSEGGRGANKALSSALSGGERTEQGTLPSSVLSDPTL
jgi:hypothetical protein